MRFYCFLIFSARVHSTFCVCTRVHNIVYINIVCCVVVKSFKLRGGIAAFPRLPYVLVPY